MIRRVLVLLLLFCSLAGAEELLHPSVAFRPSVRALDAQTVEVSFEIAKGYYLYRDKFRFSAAPATLAWPGARQTACAGRHRRLSGICPYCVP